LFQKDINVAWDLAPHDLSIILHLMKELPVSVNCRGSAHVTPGIEDVTLMCLSFRGDRSAIIHSSWLDPRKIREMTIVGSKRMIVYDDVAPLEKIRVFDARVERPPHYDTFAEFHYAYHYGDVHSPYIKQEEPLKTECQHFLDCILSRRTPLSSGVQGQELVRILEASSESLKNNGSPICLMPAGTSERSQLPQVLSSSAREDRRHRAKANGKHLISGNGDGKCNGNGNGNPSPCKSKASAGRARLGNGKNGIERRVRVAGRQHSIPERTV
jgi:hypothetical protein